MSSTSPVRFRAVSMGLSVLGLLALCANLSNAREKSDTTRTANEKKPGAVSAPAARKSVRREPIPYPTLRKPAPELRNGMSRTVQNGQDGEKEITYRVYARTDGVELRREMLASRVLKQPIPEIREENLPVPSRGQLPSRSGRASRSDRGFGGYHSGKRIVIMSATTYDPYNCGGSGSGRASTGIKARYGVVAVDPRFIPMGTHLFIEGYGYAVAGDIGGAIKGNRIDLCIDSAHDAKNIKDMKHVRVHILD